jgi:hypothetical protein
MEGRPYGRFGYDRSSVTALILQGPGGVGGCKSRPQPRRICLSERQWRTAVLKQDNKHKIPPYYRIAECSFALSQYTERSRAEPGKAGIAGRAVDRRSLSYSMHLDINK